MVSKLMIFICDPNCGELMLSAHGQLALLKSIQTSLV